MGFEVLRINIFIRSKADCYIIEMLCSVWLLYLHLHVKYNSVNGDLQVKYHHNGLLEQHFGSRDLHFSSNSTGGYNATLAVLWTV